jgi:O-acetyl-ADP-ribose deacetylase (regulator of RNase III)
MRVEIVQGDITRETVDAIVNAANSSLLGGGGVDGAIHRAAGPGLLEECRLVRRTTWPDGLPVGRAVATGAHDLPCRWVVHTVGPDRHAGQVDRQDLESCFRESLRVAHEVTARSIAFPAVSAGVYGWAPADVAAAAHCVTSATDPSLFDVVRFVLFSPPVLAAFEAEFATEPRAGR